jgi:predicted phosphodiesterase
MPEATDDELHIAYESIATPTIVYGHVHRPYVRRLPGSIIANSGSVGLPHDGNTRASYLLLDDSVPTIRRVEYDVHAELKALSASGLPHADWVARILQCAVPQMP